jgi:hypothetical protein
MKFIFGAMLAVSLIAATIYYETLSSQESHSVPLNSVTFTGTRSFEFQESNVTELTTAAGSTVEGAIEMNIVLPTPLLVYILDQGFNQTNPSLPLGISVTLTIYGNSYNVPSMHELPFDSFTGLPSTTVKLVNTTLGKTSIQFTINVGNTVPSGVYNLEILFKSILKGDMVPSSLRNSGVDTIYGYGEYYTIILYVQ